jgi:DNA polymerase elongation subunit (family B)
MATFTQVSCLKDHQVSKLSEITWSSSAYKNQDFKYIEAPGRIWVDLLPVVKRDYKFNSYKLDSVAKFFLGQQKQDLPAKAIFKCYKMFTPQSLAVCGSYCVMDSLLVLKLFEKLQTWIGLVEMSNTCNTPIFDLFTRGQQHKIYAQVYKKCLEDNIVIDRDSAELVADEKLEKFTGAYVFPPVPGIYDMVTSFDFCLTGDSLVSTTRGYSKRIENITCDDKLWVKDTSSTGFGLIQDKPVGMKCNGMKKILKITMMDGRTIRCTPDHKFLTVSGEWIKACDMIKGIEWDGTRIVKNNGTKLVMGLEQPEDIIGHDEKEWHLLDYHMNTEQDREKTLAFSRILGFVLADGWIGDRQIEACFGTLLDANLFCDDVELLTCKKSSIRDRVRESGDGSLKGSTYTVNLLSEISKKIISLEGVVHGKRSTQKPSLPAFILDEKCPISVVREFLAGLFGGDGCAPYLSNNKNNESNKHKPRKGGEKEKNGIYLTKSSFGIISLKWDVIEKFGDDMKIVMDHLCVLLKKVGVDFYQLKPCETFYYNDTMCPKDVKENPRYSYTITTTKDNNLLFSEKIGFRYCLYKSCRLSIAASFQRLSNNVRRQHDNIVKETKKIFSKGIKNIEKSLLEARTNTFQNEVPLNERFSLSWKEDIYYRKNDPSRELNLLPKYFPTALQYTEQLEVREWFADFGQSHKKTYCVSRQETHVPIFSMEVVDVRECGEELVYDIVEIKTHHNFLANGLCTSNCSLYPSVIMAYNIDYSTLVLDPSIPDDKCHVFDFWDHINCEHDKTVRKVKLKYKVCEKRYFRFLKEPIGVLPALLKYLSEARTKAKYDKKKYEKLAATLEGQEKEDAERMVVVYDKKQLAYKVSSNSMYGGLGVAKHGKLPLLPGAMSVTFMGRESIKKAETFMKNNYNITLIYGDTDSLYFSLPQYTKIEQVKDFYQTCQEMEKIVSDQFPRPIKFAFEEHIYYRFYILSKKRYLTLNCDTDGNIDKEVSSKGVLLSRRDNSEFIRSMYRDCVMAAFYRKTIDEVVYIALEYVKKVLTGQIKPKELSISKSVGNVGDYKIKLLPEDDKKCVMRLQDLGIYDPEIDIAKTREILKKIKEGEYDDDEKEAVSYKHPLEYQTIQEYISKNLPGAVQLAIKMRNRGKHVDAGERLPFIVLEDIIGKKKAKQSEKIEDIDYYIENSSVLSIDKLYYIRLAINPMDEIFVAAYKKSDIFKKIHKYRENYKKVVDHLEDIFAPKIVFQEEPNFVFID